RRTHRGKSHDPQPRRRGHRDRIARPRARGLYARRTATGAFMSDQHPIRVLSADDHALLREGIAAVINAQPDMTMIAQAWSGREGVQLFREHRPDVTLMDLRMPDISGIDALIAILAEFPDARIVMLTTFEGDVEIQRSLAAGARG